jgi:hypothetical protein
MPILSYLRVSPGLLIPAVKWENSKGVFFPLLTPMDSFSRLSLWG